jgi:predicted phage terminase large subunit-like protein
MIDERVELARRLRADLAQNHLGHFCELMDPQYQSTPHTRLLVAHLEALERRDFQNLMVFMPPRHGKTYHTSERFPAWYLGRNPKNEVVLASHGSELAEKNSSVVRALLKDDRYPFKTTVARDSWAVGRWSTDAGGSCKAVGVGSGLTGYGANCMAIDDVFVDREQADNVDRRDKMWDWYTQVARTRLMPKAFQLLTMTRWHDDDLAGRLLNSDNAKHWTLLSLPALATEEDDPLGRAPGEALWPGKFKLEEIHEMRALLGSRAFESLYQQNPIPATGGTFRAAWFNRREDAPTFTPNWHVVQAIDGAWKTGVSNDFSVIATWATDLRSFYLLDVWRGKAEFYELKRIVSEQYQKHQPQAVYCEEAASGLALLSELRSTTGIPIIGIVPKGSKESRVEVVTPMFESGRVVLPKSAAWLDDWVREHLRFPGGAHDDQVDTTALALVRLRNIAQRSIQSYIPQRFLRMGDFLR